MVTQFSIPSAVPKKDKIVASPPPKERIMAGGKYIFWGSSSSINLRNEGDIYSFRGNVFRTDSEKAVEYIQKEFIDRKAPNLIIKKVSEKELVELLEQKAVDSRPANPAMGQIEDLPAQNMDVPPAIDPPAAGLTTGMQGSIPVSGHPTAQKKD